MPRGLKEIRYKNMYYHELEEVLREDETPTCGDCIHFDVDGFCNVYNVYSTDDEDAEDCNDFEYA